MKKLVFSSLAFIVTLTFAYAQAKIEFAQETFNFGKVQETGGPVEHRFIFKNTGNAPLKIQDVNPSCGCTTPSWTKEPVMPGKEGFIIAEYNPLNRPGAFTKSLTVTSNAAPNVKTLYIKGIVNPKPKTPEEEYPVKMGNLRMRYRSMHMGDVTTKEPVTKKFDIFNESDTPLTFTGETDAPSHIKVSVEPNTIPPKSAGKIVITYDGEEKNDFGTVMDNFTIYTNESADNAKELRIQATIKEYFPPMTAGQLAEAPRLGIDDATHDFGSIKEGQKVNAEFILTNNGKSELNIRTTKSSCSCTSVDLSKENLQPGESATLKVTFDSADRRGTQQKSVSIYSNDPRNPTQRVILKGRVTGS